ncbi:MAG: iron-sulfur cluster assembly scaffold protein, partial [Clostridia bacterium]|nr:iron-sulfur cluster assembly scaffold protein [Clostridia bacterium]
EDETQHVEFSLRIEMGIITDCQFRAQANPFVVAVCSTITEMVKNKMAAMLILDGTMVKAELGEPENETNIDFCIDCVRDAVENYKKNIKKADKKAKEEKSADEQQ